MIKSCCSSGVSNCMLIYKMSSRLKCLNPLLGDSALHYSTRSQNSEEVQTVASAHALCQPTITCLSISIVSIALIEESVGFQIKLEYFWKFRNQSLEVQSHVGVTRGRVDNENNSHKVKIRTY